GLPPGVMLAQGVQPGVNIHIHHNYVSSPPPTPPTRGLVPVPRPPAMPPIGAVARISVTELRFTQNSMAGTFRCGRSLQDLVDSLNTGEISPLAPFLKLTAFWEECRRDAGKFAWFVSDNRRLWCLQKHQREMGHLVEVDVICTALQKSDIKKEYRKAQTHDRHFDTRCDGVSIHVRGSDSRH
ncbi:unnamed protein product, partial [Polarella glacialis]